MSHGLSYPVLSCTALHRAAPRRTAPHRTASHGIAQHHSIAPRRIASHSETHSVACKAYSHVSEQDATREIAANVAARGMFTRRRAVRDGSRAAPPCARTGGSSSLARVPGWLLAHPPTPPLPGGLRVPWCGGVRPEVAPTRRARHVWLPACRLSTG